MSPQHHPPAPSPCSFTPSALLLPHHVRHPSTRRPLRRCPIFPSTRTSPFKLRPTSNPFRRPEGPPRPLPTPPVDSNVPLDPCLAWGSPQHQRPHGGPPPAVADHRQHLSSRDTRAPDAASLLGHMLCYVSRPYNIF